jgi:biopolymer transport protein ExbD
MARARRLPARSKITPLVGVSLVLVVMVLFSARLSQEGMNISVPRPPEKPRPRTIAAAGDVILEYSADRRITVNRREISRAELGATLADLYRNRPEKTMWLIGAGTVRYGEIVELIDTAKGAGVERVGVITPEMMKNRR